MIQYLYLGRVGYDEGLALQAEISGLVAKGRLQNVLLLLEHPPVLTLGRNAHRSNILASDELLASRGVTIHEINRGGDVTYHGPGQLVGYPLFDLRTLHAADGGRMGPLDFVRGMEEALIRVCGGFGVPAGRIPGLTGVWCGLGPAGSADGSPLDGSANGSLSDESRGADTPRAKAGRKICAIGIHVSRGITSHGFAFNVTTDLKDFELIIPCGIPDHPVTSLENEMRALGIHFRHELPALEAIGHLAAREFGQVFGEQVLAVESMAALRAQAESAAPNFPAEDTPLRVPAEVERLSGKGEPPVRA
jgi:lipoyl(octanoyl) transferase